jgi:hypothetical protein
MFSVGITKPDNTVHFSSPTSNELEQLRFQQLSSFVPQIEERLHEPVLTLLIRMEPPITLVMILHIINLAIPIVVHTMAEQSQMTLKPCP